jgi:RsiW-degrading membrane proteinase PrsW (M82 family)
MSISIIIILFLMAFLPPIIYVVWIRNTEKFNREKWKPIIFCFIWGATIAIIASIILEKALEIPVTITSKNYTSYILIMAVIVAPIAEELTKPLALRFKIVKKELDELEDGLIYGAIAGLGFAATENLFYGYNAYTKEGLLYFFGLISIRSIVGCFLHASATAWTGYGYGKYIMKNSRLIRVIPFLLLAILIHGFYNFIPTYGVITGYAASFFVAIAFVLFSIIIVRKKIQKLDNRNNENIL